MLQTLMIILGAAVFVFWLVQVISVLTLDVSHFESHTHKLIWFLVVFSGSIVGAIWFYLWRRGSASIGKG